MFAEQTLVVHEQVNNPSWFCLTRRIAFVYPMIVIVFLSLLALVINHFYYQYPGNIYLPPNYFLLILNLFLIYSGFFLLQGHKGNLTKLVEEVIVFALVMTVVCLAINAAQYTPFPSIDQHILNLEAWFHLDSHALITWTHIRPGLQIGLKGIYNSLDYQMCYIPLMIILAGRNDLIREYYFLLITSVLIGFTFYYFFPTTAPASVINSEYFCEEQKATYLKFFQIHHGIQPSTDAGGLIAMPSFHVIWAWFCLWLLRKKSVLFMLLLPVNILLMASCVLLGWHYCLDIGGSVLVVAVAHYLYGYISSFAVA